jgi:hypothetical protein
VQQRLNVIDRARDVIETAGKRPSALDRLLFGLLPPRARFKSATARPRQTISMSGDPAT